MENIKCKRCNKDKIRKSGKVRGEQRYNCLSCNYNFIIGDRRTNEGIIALKALVVLLYSLAKGSYGMLGKIFGRDPSLIYRWIKEAALSFEEPVVEGEIKEIEFDEMWHFIGSKKTNFGSGRHIAAIPGNWLIGSAETEAPQR